MAYACVAHDHAACNTVRRVDGRGHELRDTHHRLFVFRCDLRTECTGSIQKMKQLFGVRDPWPIYLII